MFRDKNGKEERGGGDIAIYFRFAKWLSHAVKENMIENLYLRRRLSQRSQYSAARCERVST